MLPAGALSNGPHVIRVEMSDRNGRSTTAEFSIEVEHAPSLEGPWALRRKMPLSEIGFAQNILSRLGVAPGFDVILGIGEIDDEVDAARRTLASLRDQAHRDWRVVVLRRGRFAPDRLAERLLADSGDIAERITVTLDAPPRHG